MFVLQILERVFLAIQVLNLEVQGAVRREMRYFDSCAPTEIGMLHDLSWLRSQRKEGRIA